MRDFNSGDIHGDVVIQDNSNHTEYKLLIHCSNDELVHEESHRRTLLSHERSRRNGRTLKFLGFAAVLLLAATGWYGFKQAIDAASLIVGALGVMVGIATLRAAGTPTAFEQRQLATLREIHTLLRERGVRR